MNHSLILIMFLVVALAATAQTTGADSDGVKGHEWLEWTWEEKLLYVAGLQEGLWQGLEIAFYLTADNLPTEDLEKFKELGLSAGLTVGTMVETLDLFYERSETSDMAVGFVYVCLVAAYIDEMTLPDRSRGGI